MPKQSPRKPGAKAPKRRAGYHRDCSLKRTAIKTRMAQIWAKIQQLDEVNEEMKISIFALEAHKARIEDEANDRWLVASIRRAEKLQYDSEKEDGY